MHSLEKQRKFFHIYEYTNSFGRLGKLLISAPSMSFLWTSISLNEASRLKGRHSFPPHS